MGFVCLFVLPEPWAKRAKNDHGGHNAVSVGSFLGRGSTVSGVSGRLVRFQPSSQRPGYLKISSKKTSEAADFLTNHLAMDRLAGYVKGEFSLLIS